MLDVVEEDWNEILSCIFTYATDLFEHETISVYLSIFYIYSIEPRPTPRPEIGDIVSLRQTKTRHILDCMEPNGEAYPFDHGSACVHELFEARVNDGPTPSPSSTKTTPSPMARSTPEPSSSPGTARARRRSRCPRRRRSRTLDRDDRRTPRNPQGRRSLCAARPNISQRTPRRSFA